MGLGKSMWGLGSRWAKCYEKKILPVYFRFSSVTKTQARISMGLHKSDLDLLLMKTLSKFLPPEKLGDS